MTEPDWKMLAAAEKGVVDRLEPLLYRDGRRTETGEMSWTWHACEIARVRQSVFAELAEQ